MAEKEYIERGALLKRMFPIGMPNNGAYPINAKAVKVAIEQAPAADVVEVVRCKGCKHCHEYQKWNFDRYLGCNFNGEIYEVSPKHFCSYGERKEQK